MTFRTARIRPHPRAASAKDFDNHTHVALLTTTEPAQRRSLPFGDVIAERMKRSGHKPGDSKIFVTDLPNRPGTRLALAALRPDASAFERLTLARKLVGTQMEQRPKRLALGSHGLGKVETSALEALVAATLAADFELPHYKSTKEKPYALDEVAIYGDLPKSVVAQSVAEAHGNNLARYLTALPPNELTPGTYRQRVEKLAREQGWKTEFLDMKKLRRRNAGAFIAVAQGSPEQDAGILHLSYAPRKKHTARAALALVGKGICFDTGGTNLKSAKHMHGMHEDMEGSAVALGTLLALTELKVDFPVDCWLALAQNHIGPKSYRQNEVIKAANGNTIEIVHTDAEGRMVLADTLYFASLNKPRLVIDYATLTGACVGALSTRLSGVFTNRPALIPVLTRAGEESGERVWPFPLPPDFAEALKSDVADVKQCTLENDADHILASVFLKRFLAGDPDWVHVDLAAGNHKGGLAHIPTDVTGFGVRFTLNLLLAQQLLRDGAGKA
jgi:leucyl aminopeptidase